MKEAIFTLASTLERMKKRGFDMPEMVEKLHEKGISVKAPTLAKYQKKFRHGKRKKAEGKTDPPRRHWRKEKTAWRNQCFTSHAYLEGKLAGGKSAFFLLNGRR